MGYNKQDVIKEAWQGAEDAGHPSPCSMIAMARIETGGTFNPKSKNGQYAGIFQLNNGVGGCSGNSRYDPYTAAKCAVKYMEANKKQVVAKTGWWEDWMGYLSHQQGAGGLSYLLKNKDVLISSLPAAKQTVIRNNSKKGWKQDYVGDFLNNWKGVYESFTDECVNDCEACSAANMQGLGDVPVCPLGTSGAGTPQATKNTMTTALKYGAYLSVAGLIVYIFIKDIKKMVNF